MIEVHVMVKKSSCSRWQTFKMSCLPVNWTFCKKTVLTYKEIVKQKILLEPNNIFECDTLDVYAADSLNYLILDTECPKNVVGQVWFKCFVDSLSDDCYAKVVKNDSTNKLEFGGGNVLSFYILSLFKVQTPILIAN